MTFCRFFYSGAIEPFRFRCQNKGENHELYHCHHYNKTAAEKSTAVRKTTIFFILGDEIPSPVYKVKKR